MTTPTRTSPNVATSSPASTSSSAPHTSSPTLPIGSPPRRQVPLALVVAGSLSAGFLAAVALVAAPVVPAAESPLTGAVLCGFAIGWAALAALSARFTAQPQRWALVPAVVLGASGVALLAIGESAHPAVDWVWPPALLALAVWMGVHIRRDLGSRPARWLLYPAVAAMGIAAVGGAYQTVGTAADASSVSMPGRLVDVGGHRLHLDCTGTGSPTVVLEGGGGATAATLGWVSGAVARDTTTCVYDRAGRGWSEDAGTPQDALAISTDLHTLLHRAGVPGPYVLAGHSFGGLYALSFAAQHPDEIAGMVLIDSTSPDYDNADRSVAPPVRAGAHDALGRVAALTSSVARLGLGRLFAMFAASDLPPHEQAQVRATTAAPAALRSTIEEYGRADISTREAASVRDLGDTPLLVLSAGVGSRPDGPRDQARLAALSTDSVHRVVDGASHQALVGDQTHAATTGRAILQVVSAVRAGQPLSR
jgi:pimeloyl-ACP methyl ester carboxylesterase